MPHVQKQLKKLELSKKTLELVELEHKYTAGGFKPLPAFFVEGKGAKLWVRVKYDLILLCTPKK
jgi:ornithine--oxo-acid transaminase